MNFETLKLIVMVWTATGALITAIFWGERITQLKTKIGFGILLGPCTWTGILIAALLIKLHVKRNGDVPFKIFGWTP